MFYIYILYAPNSDIYYVGYTQNPSKRLEQHNTSPYNTFTSKHRPWIMVALFEVGVLRGQAMKIEKFIKNQRSRSFIEKLIREDTVLNGSLASRIFGS